MRKKFGSALLLLLVYMVLSVVISVPVMAANTKEPSKPKITSSQLVSDSAIQIKWKKAKNAKKYELYVSVNGAKYKKLKTLKKLSYKHTKLKQGYTYSYKIRAVNGKKKSAYSKVKKVSIPKPATSKPSVRDYYGKLKNTILASSSINSSGNPFISFSDYVNGSLSEAGIVYKKASDSFYFLMNYERSNGNVTVVMEIYGSNVNNMSVQPKVMYYNEKKLTAYDASTTLNMATYSGDNVNFSFGSVAGFTESNYNTMQSLCNTSLKLAFSMWDILAYSKAGVSMQQLGFLNYT